MQPAGQKILLINPPHTAIGSRIPKEQLPPLGLLSVGGPLIDAGFPVQLLDAEFGPMPFDDIIAQALAAGPAIVMMGHSGSTSAHDTIMRIASALKAARPTLSIVYGGVYPTYHWADVMRDYAQVDYIVRGEGERTATELIRRSSRGQIWRTSTALRSAKMAKSLARRRPR